jgi:hypothetical protein
MALEEPTFDAPIPGMSLTHELGARPWQQPHQFPDVESAVDYYMARMTSEEFIDQLIDILEMGVPVTVVANTMQLANVMEGKHSIDVSMLITPLLIELMMMLAESAGIEYDSGLDDPNKDKVRDSLIAKYAMQYEKELENIDTEEIAQQVDEDSPEKLDSMFTGLVLGVD